jgi:hypothetical protein
MSLPSIKALPLPNAPVCVINFAIGKAVPHGGRDQTKGETKLKEVRPSHADLLSLTVAKVNSNSKGAALVKSKSVVNKGIPFRERT